MHKSEICRKAIEEQIEKEPVVLTIGGRDNKNFTCAWCYKPIETLGEQEQELVGITRIPIPKDHPKPEQFIEEMLTRFATCKETIVKIREGAIEVIYCFCSQQHKNEFKAYFRKKGTIVKRGQANRKGNQKTTSPIKP
jgi:hypothetical protein